MKLFLCALSLLSTYSRVLGRPHNPILPGFHPDPSCIFVSEWDSTFFCASSSFNAFPGIPIHASQDLQTWRLIGNALSRPEQLPNLTNAVGGTSGIWAPTLRYHNNEFFILTTLVFDKMPIDDPARWDNIILRTKNPYTVNAWSDPVHFPFVGYDTSPFWSEDGTVYVQGAHPWQVSPHIDQMQLDLDTGEATKQVPIWNGTGGLAPEGPHVHFKDGYYYLIIAEGGTGLNHMVTAARSRNINGPFTPAPNNPLLTNANTSSYCGQSRSPHVQGRETVLTNMTWNKDEWPVFENVSGTIGGPTLPLRPSIRGNGPYTTAPDHLTFPPNSPLPIHLTHWRLPTTSAYAISPPGYPDTLRLLPSLLNLTGFDANSAETGQTFVGRRQVHSEFVFSVDFVGGYVPGEEEEEAGGDGNHHIDFGIVCLKDSKNKDNKPSGPAPQSSQQSCASSTFLRIRTTSTTATTPRPDTLVSLPSSSNPSTTHPQTTTRLEIRADNLTHYVFSYARFSSSGGMRIAGYGLTEDVSWGFTGTLLGVYATGNGRNASTPVYVSRWRYEGVRQVTSR
ncbi:glycoside hydrolase family 43 protein [Favolaschia claudopus]|uniref:Glycoside hydrolase family 43 protein n=1 Tax=Favolaschia claudopus TaxID=2862362 RepID=A0AAW0CGB0_9AGAR